MKEKNNIYIIRRKINKRDKTEVWTGWMTTGQTRELITDNFIDHYTQEDLWQGYYPFSSRLLEQMRTWVWRGGRPDHNENAHDDAILAMCILLYNLNKAKHSAKAQDTPMFIDEEGRELGSRSSNKEAKYYDTHEVRDREGYLETEDQMKQLTGAPENYDRDPLDIYRWLLS